VKKIGYAVLLGAILGAFDGLTAWLEPDIRAKPDAGTTLGIIVMLSSLKSVIVGFLVGIFVLFIQNRAAVISFGLAMGLLMAYLVAMSPDPDTGKHYYAQIMLPGGLVGLILGYATQRYARGTQAAPQG
jgi:hypothetical protein